MIFLPELDSLSERLSQTSKDCDDLYEQKSLLEADFANTKSQLTNEVIELKASLNLYKQRLESKEEVERKVRADLHQAAQLNDEVR